jgi:hypothetical protein
MVRCALRSLMIAFAPLAAASLAASAEACVVVRPLPEDVHGAIKSYPARDLAWYLLEPASLDIPDPATGLRPLMTALLLNKPKHFRELLRRGADPDLTDQFGNTALMIAAQRNEAGLVLELLQAGADPHARNAERHSFQTYLFMADDKKLSSRARRHRAQVVAWLDQHRIAIEAEGR